MIKFKISNKNQNFEKLVTTTMNLLVPYKDFATS